MVGTEHNSDLVGAGIDLEIRSSRTRETQSSIVMRRLRKTSSVLVANPDDNPLLILSFKVNARTQPVWRGV